MLKKYILLIFVPIFAYSFELDFERALNISISNNNELKILEKELMIAKFNLSRNFANLYLPSISAAGNFTYQFFTNGENITTFVQGDRTIEITNQFPDNYTFSIGVDKQIFAGFKNFNSYQSALLDFELKQKEYKDKQKEIWLKLFESYFKLILIENKLETMKVNLHFLSNQLRHSEEKFKLNLITLFELNQTNIDLKNEYLSYLQYLNEYKQEERNLIKFMGINTNLTPMDTIDSISKYISNDLPEKEEAKWIILSNDLQYLTYEYYLKKEELNKKTLEWSRLPTVYASFDYRWRYERDNTTINKRSWQRNWQVGLSFSLPIDSISPDSSTDISIKQSKENIAKVKLQKKSYESDLLNTIENYYSDLNYYSQAIKIAEEKLKLATKNLNYAQKLKELKRINDIEYLQYELLYFNIRDDYYSILYIYFLSRAKILRNL